MGIRDFFKKQEPKKEEKKIDSLQVVESPSIGVKDISKKGLKSYEEWVYANVKVRAEAVSNIEPELYRVKADEPEEVKEHESLELLHHANDFQTLRGLLQTTITHLDLTGEAFWFLDRGDSQNPKEKPKSIWPLRPDMITVIPGDLSKGEFIGGYEYQVPGKEKVQFAPWEIIQFMYVDPENPYRGKSIISASAQTIDTDNLAAEFNRRFFLNSARPDAILATEQRLQNQTLKRIRNTWNSKFRGVSNSSKLAILEQGLQYQQLQMGHKDMDFLDQQKWTRDKIMSIFGNTPVALGVVEDVNRANAFTAEAYWKEHTIKPLMQKIIDTLNEFLVPIYEDNLFLSFADPVPRDEKALVEELRDLTNVVYTYNEARALKGLPPIDGGDVLYHQMNMQEITMTSPTPAERSIKPSLKKEISKLKNRNLRRKKAAEKIEKRIDSIARSMVFKPKKKEKTKEAFHKQLMKISSGYEERFKDTLINEVYPFIQRQTEEAIRASSKSINKKDRKAEIKEFLFDRDRMVEFSKNSFDPLMAEISREQLGQTVSFYDINADPEDKAKDIREFADTHSQKAAESFTNTANERLQNALEEQAANEASQAALIAATGATVEKLKKNQAERVAISETSRATNFGILAGLKLAGIRYKEWFTALDERVCPWCGVMEGKTMKVGEKFFDYGDSLTAENENRTPVTLNFDYGAIKHPPLHTSCRCTLSPSFTQRSVDIDEKKIVEQAQKAAKEEAKKISEKATAEDRVKLQTVLDRVNEALEEDAQDKTKMEETLNKIEGALDDE